MEFVFIHRKTGELTVYSSIFATPLYAKMQMGKDFEYLGEL